MNFSFASSILLPVFIALPLPLKTALVGIGILFGFTTHQRVEVHKAQAVEAVEAVEVIEAPALAE